RSCASFRQPDLAIERACKLEPGFGREDPCPTRQLRNAKRAEKIEADGDTRRIHASRAGTEHRGEIDGAWARILRGGGPRLQVCENYQNCQNEGQSLWPPSKAESRTHFSELERR